MGNYAMTVPLPMALDNQQEGFRKLVELGYKEAWSSEANGPDAFMPLFSGYSRSELPGTAIVPAFTRGPALMAQSVATIAAIAPSRFVLGIGSSSNVIVESGTEYLSKAL